MRKILTFITCFFLLSAPATIAQPSRFEAAHDLYVKGIYDSALTVYLTMVEAGQVSAEVYYNIGNCHYKSGNLAGALLFYEKARNLDPGDEDINYNLQLAQSQTIDNIEPLPEIFYNRWYRQVSAWLSPDQWAVIAIGMLWATALAFAFFFIAVTPSWKRVSFFSGFVLGFITVLSIGIAADGYFNMSAGNDAIIFETSVYVKSSPEVKGTNLFQLHEGSKVRIMDEVSGWWKIRIANGNSGWLPASSGKII